MEAKRAPLNVSDSLGSHKASLSLSVYGIIACGSLHSTFAYVTRISSFFAPYFCRIVRLFSTLDFFPSESGCFFLSFISLFPHSYLLAALCRLSYNSGYREYFKERVKTLVNSTGVDGIWLDVVSVRGHVIGQ